MARHLLVWGGPVASFHMKAALPETDLLTVSHGAGGGIGSDAFSLLAQSYLRPDGHILPHLLADYGKNIADYDDVSLAGFSAFHGMANQILLHDSDLVTACVCLDACFSNFQKIDKAGYVLFGAMAARGERLFVLSGSLGGGGTYTTGVQCVEVNVAKAAEAAGVELFQATLPEGVPEPARSWQAESLVGLDYQGAYTHGDHVHKLGTPLLEGYLAPWLVERRIPGMSLPEDEEDSAPSRGWGIPLLVTLVAVGAGVAIFSPSSLGLDEE